jgi:hypothetical protein
MAKAFVGSFRGPVALGSSASGEAGWGLPLYDANDDNTFSRKLSS